MAFRTLIAATLPRHEKKVHDAVTKNFTLLKLLGDKDIAPKLYTMKEPEASAKYAPGIELVDDPGRTIITKLRKGRNSTAKAYERFDTLDTAPQDNADEAEWQWKSISAAVHLSVEDLDKNRGSKTKIFDLLEFSMDDGALTLQELLNDYLLGSVPNTSEGLKRPTGLLDLVQDDPTTLPAAGSAVIGGIDASVSANSYWRNQVENFAAGTFGTDQTGDGHAALRRLIQTCTFGSMRPNVILAGSVAYRALQRSLVSQARYNDMKRSDALVSAGMEHIMFDNVPVVWEPQIDVQRSANSLSNSAFYALNLDNLTLKGMKFRWFKATDFREPTNQDSQIAHYITRCQFVAANRRTHGVMFNVDAT